MTQALILASLAVCHFVCPLLFFTDLTRNPYVSQIALLNVCLIVPAAAYILREAFSAGAGPPGGGSACAWRLPKTPLDLPIACWLCACVLTWLLAYFGHLPYFRDSMRAEGLRVMLFTVVNTVLPFYLAALRAQDCPAEPEVRLGAWVAFALAWGGLWTLYPQMRGGTGSPVSIWDHVWNSYGALLWAGGLAAAFRLTRRGGVHEFWHLALLTGFLASVYGISQYFNLEWIWPRVLNPYGGRSVSTFGNPNFMSSYMVMLAPVAAVYYLGARTPSRRAVYAVVLLALEGCLLCSLTRSSWAGALAAMGFLFLFPEVRRKATGDLQAHGLVFTAAVLLILFWPQTAVKGYTPSVLGRVTELSSMLDTKAVAPYSPLYQRVLIWSCAWLMGHENPLFGQGWGHFELFYPFYQGPQLLHFDMFLHMRTHANNAHNEIMEVFAQMGLLGVGLEAWLWTTFLACAWKWARAERLEPEPAWIIAAAAGVVGMLVDNLLNVSMHFAVPAFLLWWQAGTVMGRPAEGSRGWRLVRFPNRAFSFGLAAALAAAGGWGGWFWWRQWNREADYFMGFKLLRSGQMTTAIEKLEEAHRWHPREVNADYELGNAYARTNEFQKALWAYDEALKSNAGYDEIYYNRASIFGRLGNAQEALKNYQMSYWINPISYEIYNSLSQFFLRDPQRFRRDALELLNKGLHYYPTDANFLNNLGYLYGLGDDYAKAQEAWTKALKVNPDLAQAEKNLLAALARSKGPRPPVLDELAALRELEARIGRKDYSKETLALSRKVHEAFPDLPKSRFYRGNLELMHGDAQAAVSLLEPLAQKEPENAALQLNLGQAYLRAGRMAEAAAVFRRALAADPGNAAVRDLLAKTGR